ncbi:MAG: DUF4349 domain-containing protein [Candidatus Omnitrophica bacterium]|nr:DUF4349 domain-containing protein [Candidatus Omnitrophota bacterium]
MDLKKISGWKWIGLCVLAFLAIIVIQTYAHRGLQGRLRSSYDDIGDQFSSSKTLQYEPYYSESRTMDKSVSARVGAVNAAPVAQAPAMIRKVIKNASVSLKVKDCDVAQAGILKLVKRQGGMIINSSLNKNSYAPKSGMAVFKVSPDKLDMVLQALKALGDVESEHVTGEDVTEQYVDLVARLENWKMVKARLAKILEEKAREVKDVLEIERELARVGGEIDALEGRLKFLDRQVDLSTVTVNFREDRLGITQALNFGEKFRSALRTALETSINTFNGVIILLGFLLPLALWAGAFWLIYLLGRKIFGKNK